MQTVSIIREKFMKKIIVTFIATITAALLLCFSVSAFDNNDYGGGGGYDFGGGDYGGGYDYGGNDYDSSSYSGDTDPVSVIIGIGIVVVIHFDNRRKQKEIRRRHNTSFINERRKRCTSQQNRTDRRYYKAEGSQLLGFRPYLFHKAGIHRY